MREQMGEIKDISDAEKEKGKLGLELAKGKDLDKVVKIINDLAVKIEGDEKVTGDDVLKLDEALGRIKVDFYGQKLTFEEAGKILKDNEKIYKEIREGNLINIDKLTYITPEVAERLSKCRGDLGFNVTFLSDQAAQCFSEHKGGSLTFNGLASLSDQAVRYLSKHQGSLWLLGSPSLSDQGVEYLAEMNFYIAVNSDISDRIHKFKMSKLRKKKGNK